MSFCLPKKDANEFLAALKTGKIRPDQLMDMTSAERRAHFATIVGPINAEGVNTAFESKLLLKDQQAGLIRWAQQMGGLSPKTRSGFIDKIRKLENVLEPADEKAYLADLAAKKFGSSLTFNEAKTISQGAKDVSTLREKWNPDTQQWASEEDRLAYGAAYVAYQDYVGALMRDANSKTFTQWLLQPKAHAVLDIANSIKGIVASLDNSFFGRQGLKTLANHPGIWANGFVKSWGDMYASLRGADPIAAIKADILSRPNAMNGRYNNMKLALGQDFEEAFPTTLPEKIPGLGRLYKMSESAFVGAALRFRADIADIVIPKAEAFGVDLSEPGQQAQAIGDLVNAMTGRGNIGRMSGEWTNAAFFSVRFLKSNWDTLTAHTLGFGIEKGPARDFVRRQAARNLLGVVGLMALIYTIAGMLDPDSIELDPRSSNFGKIKIGDTRFDISGGMASLVTLASRLAYTQHNGKWGHWSKSSVTGRYTNLSSGKFGAQTALDVVESFIEGKASPLLGKALDMLRGRDFAGNKLTFTNQALGLVTPIGASTAYEALQDPNSANLAAIMILDGLGFGANTYGRKRQRTRPREIWERQYWEGEDDLLPQEGQ